MKYIPQTCNIIGNAEDALARSAVKMICMHITVPTCIHTYEGGGKKYFNTLMKRKTS